MDGDRTPRKRPGISSRTSRQYIRGLPECGNVSPGSGLTLPRHWRGLPSRRCSRAFPKEVEFHALFPEKVQGFIRVRLSKLQFRHDYLHRAVHIHSVRRAPSVGASSADRKCSSRRARRTARTALGRSSSPPVARRILMPPGPVCPSGGKVSLASLFLREIQDHINSFNPGSARIQIDGFFLQKIDPLAHGCVAKLNLRDDDLRRLLQNRARWR